MVLGEHDYGQGQTGATKEDAVLRIECASR